MLRPRFAFLVLSIGVVLLAGFALSGAREPEPQPTHGERQGPRRAEPVVPDRYIVLFRGSVQSPTRETEARERRDAFRARFVYRRAVKGFSAKLSARQVERLEADPEVASVTPDRKVQAV